MNFTRKEKIVKAPLCVKEVILPSEKRESVQFCERAKSDISTDIKNMEDCKVKPDSDYLKIGSHEVRPVKSLITLEKKPLECYFEGLSKKQPVKKKIKKPKLKSYHNLIFENSSAPLSDGQVSFLNKALPKEKERNIVEENLQKRRVQIQMRTYEVLKKHEEEINSARQRLAEKNYLEQQENLVETWTAILKRKSEVREKVLEDFLSCPDSYSNYSRCRQTVPNDSKINIFLLSKKFWDDGEESKVSPGNKKEEDKEKEKKEERREEKKTATAQKYHSILDDIEDDFCSKLVFVDNEDSDEFDCKH